MPMCLEGEPTPCPYSPMPATPSLKTPSGWPVPRSPTGTSTCRWRTGSALFIRTRSSRRSFRGAVNPQKRQRAWPGHGPPVAEGLSDRQAADAVRSRIDWKYVLGLELTDPGFDHTVLSEFRTRLITGQAEALLLEALLTLARAQGLLKVRGRQRTDSTHVVGAIRVLNRLERVGETLRAALNSLAVVAPAWVQTLAPLEWYERYGHRVENYQMPKTDAARKALAAVIGADGQMLLRTIDAASEQPWLREMPAVQTLRRVWAEQYAEVNGTLSWREVKDMPSPAALIASPYDPEAR